MSSNVLHPVIPAAFPLEVVSTDATLAAQGRFALLVPAPFPDTVQATIEALTLFGGRGARVVGPALSCPGGVHATQV